MRSFRFVSSVLLLSFFGFCASAETVTITVVQNEEAPSVARQMSQTIEDELLGDYFDYGHIATNTELRYDGTRFTERYFGVKEAAQGFSDYLVAILLTYGPGEKKDAEKNITWAELQTLVWRLVRVSDSTILAENSIDVTKIQVTDFDPYNQSRIVADEAGTQSLAAILKAKKKGDVHK